MCSGDHCFQKSEDLMTVLKDTLKSTQIDNPWKWENVMHSVIRLFQVGEQFNSCMERYIPCLNPIWSTYNSGIKSSLVYSHILKSFSLYNSYCRGEKRHRDEVPRQNTAVSKLEYPTQHSLFAQIINQDFFCSSKLGAGSLVISRRVLEHVGSCLVATSLFSSIG